MQDNMPNNSHQYRDQQKIAVAERKKVSPVAKGKVVNKKKSTFADVFVAEDVANVKSYILMDVLIPAAKKAISDVVTNGIDMILYGSSGRDRKGSRGGGYISYRDYSDSGRSRQEPRSRERFDFGDITFDNKGEAEAVLYKMDEILDRYGIVTVADLFDTADLTAPYTANKYGWTNLRNAEVVRGRDGYMIKLPRAMVID